jgi:hypothetical protein
MEKRQTPVSYIPDQRRAHRTINRVMITEVTKKSSQLRHAQPNDAPMPNAVPLIKPQLNSDSFLRSSIVFSILTGDW